jgi:hypothetical protein
VRSRTPKPKPKPKRAPKGPLRSAAGVTLAKARELSLALPETLERPCYGTPAFYVRDKLFARVLPGGESIVIKTDFDIREALLSSAPEVFSVTPHYQGYPMVIVRLATVKLALLQDLLTEAWRHAAPRRLIAAFDAGRSKSW